MYIKPESDKTWQWMKLFASLGVCVFSVYELYQGYATGEVFSLTKHSEMFVSYQDAPMDFVYSVGLYIVVLFSLGVIARRLYRKLTGTQDSDTGGLDTPRDGG